MRAPCWSRAAAICGALALACSVETEGAPCGLAGDTTQCPSGQACGNDLRCSVRALECEDAGTRCQPGTHACRGESARTCTDSDPACGAWDEVLFDCVDGLVCKGAAERCDCPDTGPIFEVDGTNVNPTGPNGPLTPSGASSHPGCRFATLGAALAAAGTYAAENGGTATVRAMVDPEGGFGPAAGDPLPIVLPAGVTLESEDAASPTASLIASDSTVASAMVRLDAGATIAGFTLRNQLAIPGIWSGNAIELDAGGTVSSVAVETNSLAYGIRASGAAPVSIVDVHVDGPRRAGVSIDLAAGVQADVVGGSYISRALAGDTAGGHGIWIRGGSVSIRSEDTVTFSPLTGVFAAGSPVDVSGSTGSGVRIDKGTASTPVALTIDRVRIATNGAAGVHAFNVASGTALSIASSLVEGNNATNATTYFSPPRVGGGIVVSSPAPLTLDVQGSRVWRNTGDQIGLDVPDVVGAYDVSGGPACGDTSNVLGSCSATAEDVFSTTETTFVPAQQNYWQGAPRVTYVEYQPVCAWVPPSCP